MGRYYFYGFNQMAGGCGHCSLKAGGLRSCRAFFPSPLGQKKRNYLGKRNGERFRDEKEKKKGAWFWREISFQSVLGGSRNSFPCPEVKKQQ